MGDTDLSDTTETDCSPHKFHNRAEQCNQNTWVQNHHNGVSFHGMYYSPDSEAICDHFLQQPHHNVTFISSIPPGVLRGFRVLHLTLVPTKQFLLDILLQRPQELRFFQLGCAWYRDAKFYECAVAAGGGTFTFFNEIVEDLKSIQDVDDQASTSKINSYRAQPAFAYALTRYHPSDAKNILADHPLVTETVRLFDVHVVDSQTQFWPYLFMRNHLETLMLSSTIGSSVNK